MRSGSFALGSLLAAAIVSLASAARAVSIDWVTIGNPGNACEDQIQGLCFGAVASVYQIARTEVTNDQYAEFLNAVADTDPHALYNPNMGSSVYGGITRDGDPGSFSYAATAGRGDQPVNFVSYYDALRFTNWLHNGQPTGAQSLATTEGGAYTFAGTTTVGPRNPLAAIFLSSEDEWYKAAYYDALSLSYFDYPAGSDTQTACAAPGGAANRANCSFGAGGNLADVGGYTGSPSPYGTFDQGGNVAEWNENPIGGFPSTLPTTRVLRGGSFLSSASNLAAAFRDGIDPASESLGIGFRPAAIPEPGTGLLVIAGLLGLAARRHRG